MKNKILLLLLLFLMPIIVVNADASGIISSTYDGIINNEKGAKFYEANYNSGSLELKETDIIIPYHAFVEVYNEDYYNGGFYAEIQYYDEKNKAYYGYISIDDVDPNDPYFYEDTDVYSSFFVQSGELLILRDNISLYEGPSYTFAKTKYTLNKDDKVSFTASSRDWFYVEHNGEKGWLKYHDIQETRHNAALINEESTILFLKNFDAYEEPLAFDAWLYIESNKVTTVPAGTEMKYIASADRNILIEYNGKKGWVYSNRLDFVLSQNQKGIYIKDDKLPIYSDYDCTNVIGYMLPNDEFEFIYTISSNDSTKYKIKVDNVYAWMYEKERDIFAGYETDLKIMLLTDGVLVKDTINNEVLENLKAGEKYEVLYSYANYLSYDNYLYIKTKNNSGWIYLNEDVKYAEYDNHYKLTLSKNTNFYSSPLDDREKLDKKLKAGDVVYVDYIYSTMDEIWYYTEYDGVTGWFITDDTLIQVDDPLEVTSEQDKPVVNKKDSLSKVEIALIGVGAAVVIATTSIVSIVLIKKSKKNYLNQETKKED